MTRIWALADTHLSFAKPKPMDIFGSHWTNHPERIAKVCQAVIDPGDLLLMPGDLSWALKRKEAEPDLEWIAALPGTKVLCKGNHDYWWDSDAALNYPGLYDTPYVSPDGRIGVAGTRGWFDPMPGMTEAEAAQTRKIVTREVGRLRKRLDRIADCEIKYALIHYPPIDAFAEMLKDAGVRAVLYGHLHLNGSDAPLPERWHGLRCHCTAVDRLGFAPLLVDTLS